MISAELLFISSLNLIGYKTIEKMLAGYGNHKWVFELSDEEILFELNMSQSQKMEFIKARRIWKEEEYIGLLKKNGIKLLTFYDSNYPDKLRNIENPPFKLFYKGSLPEAAIPTVSIIGARNCSDYGKMVARYFAKELSYYGVQIVSGLASGIDGIAQRMAVESGGKSYGILGCGADICYPRSNRDLYNELIQKGGVLSEFTPGTKPLARHFPMRNRIISGLADIVLVVEAKEKSGTAITVDMALEQGKEVFAVPGKITDELSAGCNKLISQGAGVARKIEDILDALSISLEKKVLPNARDENLPEDFKNILNCLGGNALTIDEIMQADNYKGHKLVEDIMVLCMKMMMEDLLICENGRYMAKSHID